MSEDLDDQLRQRLQAGAPAQRDPLFRVGVLQRREQDRYRLRNRLIGTGAAVMAAALTLGLVLRPELIDEAAAALFVLGAIAAAWIFSPAVRNFARRWTP